MRPFFGLKPFSIYNIILIIIFCNIVNFNIDISIFYTCLFCIFHFLLIYLSIYHNRKILYFIYFFYGLILDILWINEIGVHLLIFMILLFFMHLFLKFFYLLSSSKIYFAIIIIQIVMILSEMLLSSILYDYKFNSFFIIQITFISLLMSYPIFLLFSKIDQLN